MITDVLQEISPDDQMYLINALYFAGNWTYEFDPEETLSSTFTMDNGEDVEVPFMNSSGLDFTYLWENDFSAVRMPYGNESLAMYIFVPEYDITLSELIQNLDIEDFNNWFGGYEHITEEMQEGMSFSMPLFDIEFSMNYNDLLMNLGMVEAFSSIADFSRMCMENLWISFVKQDACISVNEAGTEAAAATIVGMTSGIHPFYVSRPFLYIIRDDRNGSILFSGIMNDPSI